MPMHYPPMQCTSMCIIVVNGTTVIEFHFNWKKKKKKKKKEKKKKKKKRKMDNL